MNHCRKFISLSAALLLNLSASAATLEDLAIFKSGGMTQGLWRMELLSSSEPMLNQGAAAMGKMSICADVAKQMSKNSQLDEQSCIPKVLRNSKDAAEVAVSCKDGARSHMQIHRDGDKSFLIDSEMTNKEGKTRTMKARYSYEGVCKESDALIRLDKDSTACKQMGNVDMSKMAGMCASAPEQYRARCEQQMKQMAGACQ